jgi:UDP-glucuronate decarboxylase
LASDVVPNKDLRNIIKSKEHQTMKYKVLITGVTGFLCSKLAKKLLEDGHEVWGLCRNPTKASELFGAYPLYKSIIQDVCESLDLNIQFDYIVHGASPASPQMYKNYPVDVIKPNTIGTYLLLQYARMHPPKNFMFISSAAVYGEKLSEPCDENTPGVGNPLELRSCYEESKRLGENLVVSFCHQYDVNGVILRPYHVYGPGMSLGDGRVVSDFVGNAKKCEDIIIRGDGKTSRTLLYIDDFVDGALMVLFKGANAEAYNIGNPYVELTTKEMADTISSIYGLNVIVNAPVKEGYLPSPISKMPINVNKLLDLGWTPVVGFDQGIKMTIESLA